jgi:hypothetical protein
MSGGLGGRSAGQRSGMIELRCMCFGSSTLPVQEELSGMRYSTVQCVRKWRAVVAGAGGRGDVMRCDVMFEVMFVGGRLEGEAE